MSHARASATVFPAVSEPGARWHEGSSEFVTARSHAAVAVGAVLQLIADTGGPRLKAVATIADAAAHICVAVDATDASGNWIKVQTRGFAEALVDGDSTDVVAGDSLKVVNAAGVFVIDQTDNSLTVNSSAIAVDANAGASALKTVWLLGTPCTV